MPLSLVLEPRWLVLEPRPLGSLRLVLGPLSLQPRGLVLERLVLELASWELVLVPQWLVLE